MNLSNIGVYVYRILNDEFGDAKEDVPVTPTRDNDSEPFDSTPNTNGKSYYSAGKPSKLVTPFGQRTQKLVVKFSANNVPDSENGTRELELRDRQDEDDVIRKVQPGRKCSLTVHSSKPETGCRFMYDRIEDRVRGIS